MDTSPLICAGGETTINVNSSGLVLSISVASIGMDIVPPTGPFPVVANALGISFTELTTNINVSLSVRS